MSRAIAFIGVIVALTCVPAASLELATVMQIIEAPSSPVTVTGTDVIINGGFENPPNPDEWNLWNAKDTNVHTGTWAYELFPGTVWQCVPGSSTQTPLVLDFWLGDVTQHPDGFSYIWAGIDGYDIPCGQGGLPVARAEVFRTTEEFTGWRRVICDVSHFASETMLVEFAARTTDLQNPSRVGKGYIDDVRLMAGAGIYCESTPTLALQGLGTNPGGSAFPLTDIYYRIGTTGDFLLYTAPFTLPDEDGVYTVQYYGVYGSAGEEVNSTQITIDSGDPTSALLFYGSTLVQNGNEKIVNGGFEDPFAGWAYGGTAARTSTQAHSGSFSLSLAPFASPGSASQTVSIAPGAKLWLVFWSRADSAGFSAPSVSIRDGDGKILWAADYRPSGAWGKQTISLADYSGQTITIEFADPGLGTFLDDVSLVENPVVTVPGDNLATVLGYDASAGVGVRSHTIDGGPVQTADQFNVQGSGPHTVFHWATDNAGHEGTHETSSFVVDADAPSGTLTIDNGAAATENTTVTLDFTASDSNGVPLMRIKTDTGSYGPWVAFAASQSYTFQNTVPGEKTICVQFQDGAGNVSQDICASIVYRLPGTMRIGEAKKMPVGSSVAFENKIVTAIHTVLFQQGSYYIQEQDGSAGILVESAFGMPSARGDTVTVQGFTALNEGELYLLRAGPWWLVETSTSEPAGVHVPMSDLGGGPFGEQPGIGLMSGLNTIGLLVTVCGRVIDIQPEYYVIDDGTGVLPGGSAPGVSVEGLFDVIPPVVGDMLLVTGVSTAEVRNGMIVNHIRPRAAFDIVKLN